MLFDDDVYDAIYYMHVNFMNVQMLFDDDVYDAIYYVHVNFLNV